MNNFAVFILTHGRPDKCITFATLRKYGYTGKVYFILDSEDKTKKEYIKNFGKENIITFNKKEVAERTDRGDNFKELGTVLFARNEQFNIANKIGIKYFIVLDDDYNDFRYKIDNNFDYIPRYGIKNLDKIFRSLLNYYKSIPKLLCLSIAQGGDFFGGVMNESFGLQRKCMNFYVCNVDKPFEFCGRMNDDVNTYMTNGSRGGLFLTIPFLALQQKATQKTKGGLTEMYLSYGTYLKSFYTVLFCPSFSKVTLMQSKHPRLHHTIYWDNAVPVIISDEYKKK
jgi:hypothetical protein